MESINAYPSTGEYSWLTSLEIITESQTRELSLPPSQAQTTMLLPAKHIPWADSDSRQIWDHRPICSHLRKLRDTESPRLAKQGRRRKSMPHAAVQTVNDY